MRRLCSRVVHTVSYLLVYKLWLKWRTTMVVSAAFAAGAIFQALLRSTNDQLWLTLSIAAGLVGVIVVPVFKDLDTRGEKRLLEKYQTRIHDSLTPLLQLHVQLSEAREKAQQSKLLQRLLQTCLIAAKGGTGDARVRASYYRVQPRLGSKKERLEPETSVGRNISASSVFEKGTKNGNEVFRRLNANETTFQADTSKIDAGQLPGWNTTKNRDYKTFISVPVRGESSIYGMLTVDSTEVGDLTEYDEMYVRCIGLLLASGIAIASPE
jgi:hypothetical protein